MHLSKPTECTRPRVNPKVNYGLWVIMMCQGGFISCNRWTTLVGMLIIREAVHVWGQEVDEKSVPSFNFATNLKLF